MVLRWLGPALFVVSSETFSMSRRKRKHPPAHPPIGAREGTCYNIGTTALKKSSPPTCKIVHHTNILDYNDRPTLKSQQLSKTLSHSQAKPAKKLNVLQGLLLHQGTQCAKPPQLCGSAATTQAQGKERVSKPHPPLYALAWKWHVSHPLATRWPGLAMWPHLTASRSGNVGK